MKFLVDADVPRSVAKVLISLGHDAIDIRDIKPPATPDITIYNLIKEQNRILITRDLDFSNILLYPPPPRAGIIVLRAHLLPTNEIIDIVKDLVKRIPEKELIGSLIVARKGRYRLRRT